MKNLNLGCGKEKLGGYLNCDIDPNVSPDKIVDFNRPLPFRNNAFEKVRMCHSLEHTQDLGFTLSECFRVGKVVELWLPSPNSPRYDCDEHNYFFRIRGLRGRSHKWMPGFLQRLLGMISPMEYKITIEKR